VVRVGEAENARVATGLAVREIIRRRPMVAVLAELEARRVVAGRLSANKSEKKPVDDEGINDEAARKLPPQNAISDDQTGHRASPNRRILPRDAAVFNL
jgi:hypothetical protein